MNLTWSQELPTSDGRPYLRRWILDFGPVAVRLHHWLCSDDERAPHDHPYWLWTLILKGGYDDMGYANISSAPEWPIEHEAVIVNPRRRGSFQRWPAEHLHYVKVHEGGCWSLCLSGRQTRIWGFWTERWDEMRRFERSSRYFRKHGHHACDR